MNILVLGGGDSPERDVSLRSAKAVRIALESAGYKVFEEDPTKGIQIVLSGAGKNTIVFPILHGAGGEDGVIQKTFEEKHIPFLGSGSLSSANCFDKWKTRQLFSVAGLPIANGELVDSKTYQQSFIASKPHALKVLHGGSSIGTLIVRNPEKVDAEAVDKLFDLDKQAVIEELVMGIEITVPILDKKALSVIEIMPPEGLEFDYENKYNGTTAEICPPRNISIQMQNKAQELAEKAHQTLDCRHLSRVDMIIKPNGEIVLLEINTIPGLTDQSLYPKSAAVAGLPMPEMVKKFVQMVERDYNL